MSLYKQVIWICQVFDHWEFSLSQWSILFVSMRWACCIFGSAASLTHDIQSDKQSVYRCQAISWLYRTPLSACLSIPKEITPNSYSTRHLFVPDPHISVYLPNPSRSVCNTPKNMMLLYLLEFCWLTMSSVEVCLEKQVCRYLFGAAEGTIVLLSMRLTQVILTLYSGGFVILTFILKLWF